MLLYYVPGACSLSVDIALREAGLPFELKKVDIHTKQMEGGGDFLHVNSKGYVPALRLDGGAVLTEAAAILQYVADQRPQSGLAPKAGTLERYRLQEWLSFLSSEVHKSFSPLFNPALGADWKAGTTANLSKRLDWLDAHLRHQSHLLGDQFTVADALLYVMLNWAGHVGLDLARWPSLAAFHRRVGERPKVVEALRAEGLAK
jgi:glutathione S-transferase